MHACIRRTTNNLTDELINTGQVRSPYPLDIPCKANTHRCVDNQLLISWEVPPTASQHRKSCPWPISMKSCVRKKKKVHTKCRMSDCDHKLGCMTDQSRDAVCWFHSNHLERRSVPGDSDASRGDGRTGAVAARGHRGFFARVHRRRERELCHNARGSGGGNVENFLSQQ